MTESTGEQQSWLDGVSRLLDQHQRRGCFFVGFPAYRPDLVRALAHGLALEHFDIRSELLVARGWGATSFGLDELDRALQDRAGQTGLVAQNVEALLATKTQSERQTWLAAQHERDHSHPLVIPIVLFLDDLGKDKSRLHRLRADSLPEQTLLSRLAL